MLDLLFHIVADRIGLRRRAPAHYPMLKNSNFRGDHNSEDRWQPRWKFPWGLSGATDFSADDPLSALAVASTRGDNAFRAEVGFSRHLNFRLFQQYLRIPAEH